MLVYGSTEQEVVENRLAADFAELCERSPNRCPFTYNGTQYIGVLSSGARSAAQSESKIVFYLRGPKSIALPEGAVITTHDRGFDRTRYWIVMNQEVHPYYGYYEYKMLELDYMLKYVGTDGQEHTIPCYINGTGTFDIKEYFKFSNRNIVEKPNRALNAVWSTTDLFDDTVRFIIGKETWRYVDEDRISIPGVSYVTMYAIGIDESQDSVDEQLAGQERLESLRIVSNYGEMEEDTEISISDEFENLQFYLMRFGKIIKSNFTYEISDGFANLNDDGTFELLGSDGTIKVTDSITGYSQVYSFVIDQVSDYFYVIGDENIDVFSTNYYTFNTDYDDFSFDFDSSKVAVSRLKDGRLKVVARSTLGATSINFTVGGTTIGTLDLTIGSSWRQDK